jgi:hypothetical protein
MHNVTIATRARAGPRIKARQLSDSAILLAFKPSHAFAGLYPFARKRWRAQRNFAIVAATGNTYLGVSLHGTARPWTVQIRYDQPPPSAGLWGIFVVMTAYEMQAEPKSSTIINAFW